MSDDMKPLVARIGKAAGMGGILASGAARQWACSRSSTGWLAFQWQALGPGRNAPGV